MKVYKKKTTLDKFEKQEKYVFTTFIQAINYWDETDELDLMICSDNRNGCLTRFNTIKADLISDNLGQLKKDTINLGVLAFWYKYQTELSGIWHDFGKIKVIFIKENKNDY